MSNETAATKTRGRPREFDDEAVLDSLVQLFWEQGFEATSMNDIVQTSGLSKSSLYNTFGSKDELFERALNRYVDLRSSMLTTALVNGTSGLEDLGTFFDLMWAEVDSMDDHRGCLAVNTSTELGQRDQGVVNVGSRYRTIMRSAFHATLQRAAVLGEIDPKQVDSYTNVLVSFVMGTAVIVRSGADNDELFGQIEAARSMIDGWRLR